MGSPGSLVVTAAVGLLQGSGLPGRPLQLRCAAALGRHGSSPAMYPRGATELRRRLTVGLFEGGAEVAVAGESEVDGKVGDVVVLAQSLQRLSQPQLQL